MTTEQLLADARQGNKEALMRLLFEFHQPLLAYVRANIGEHLNALVSEDDVLQETFVGAMRSIDQQQHADAEAFHAWLRTIAANRIRDAARAAKAKKRGGDFARVQQVVNPFRSHAGDLLAELSNHDPTPSRNLARDEAIDAMQVAISVLPEDQREAIRLHYFERLTLVETATAMGRSTGSVRGLIQRAKQHLRDQMERSSKWLSGG